MSIQRIMIDQEYAILYRNSMGLFYSTPMSPTHFYPFENLIKVHHHIRGNTISLEDNHVDHYRIVHIAKLETYTCKKILVSIHVEVATTTHYRETYVPKPYRVTHIDCMIPNVIPFLIETLKLPFSRMHLDEDPRPREGHIGSIIPLPLASE